MPDAVTLRHLADIRLTFGGARARAVRIAVWGWVGTARTPQTFASGLGLAAVAVDDDEGAERQRRGSKRPSTEAE